MDRDQTPIGGLYAPLQPTSELFVVSVIMDTVALIFSFFISYIFAMGILLYILASRAYSYRGIRLKKYALTGFLTVFVCQGALIYALSFLALSHGSLQDVSALNCLIASCLIGALYPLTQIYQHEPDKADGVTTISYVLGKKGTFIFSAIFFVCATILFLLRFWKDGHMNHFYVFLLVMLPVVLFFLYWMRSVWRNSNQANFKNSFIMSLVATLCSAAFFITLIILNH